MEDWEDEDVLGASLEMGILICCAVVTSTGVNEDGGNGLLPVGLPDTASLVVVSHALDGSPLLQWSASRWWSISGDGRRVRRTRLAVVKGLAAGNEVKRPWTATNEIQL